MKNTSGSLLPLGLLAIAVLLSGIIIKNMTYSSNGDLSAGAQNASSVNAKKVSPAGSVSHETEIMQKPVDLMYYGAGNISSDGSYSLPVVNGKESSLVSLTLTPSATVVPQGTGISMSWYVYPAGPAHDCVASTTPAITQNGVVGWNNSTFSAGGILLPGVLGGVTVPGNPGTVRTYILTCPLSTGGSVSASTVVTVSTSGGGGTFGFGINPSTVSPGGTTTISRTVSGLTLTSCSASALPPNGVPLVNNGVNGWNSTNSFPSPLTNGSTSGVSIPGVAGDVTTYKLTCQLNGGPVTFSITGGVNAGSFSIGTYFPVGTAYTTYNSIRPKGYVDPMGNNLINVWFEYQNAGGGSWISTPHVPNPNGFAAGDFIKKITGLSPTTTYNYKACGSNGMVSGCGNTYQVTTKSYVPPPPVPVDPPQL